ncbi:protein FAR1-RELATED SEQUENCE 6-like [Forsythia ovata]|uniref:Protein FAR1-RELATED SEQUENCE 6-like n=1 Tax=Forsythia ovata TaxID=205694 RepID=A0ABD1TRI8_9LAMI
MLDMSDEEYEDEQEHTLSVLLKLDKQKIPEKFILARWRKDIKRTHTRVKVTYDDWKGDHDAQRYNKLQKKLDDVADLAVISDENCDLLWNMMDEFQSKISKHDSTLRSCALTSTNATGDVCKSSGKSNGLRSPLAVRKHRRPPKSRKVSNVEKFVDKKKKREDKKNQENNRKN